MRPAGSMEGDLRLPMLAAVVWASAAVAHVAPLSVWVSLLGLLVLGWLVSRQIPTAMAIMLLALPAGGGVMVRTASVQSSLGWQLAQDRASVSARVVVAQDPRVVEGPMGKRASFQASVIWVEGRGRAGGSAPVRLSLPADRWGNVAFGQTLDVDGRLAPARDRWLAAVLDVRGPPRLVAEPPWWDSAAATFRASVRHAVEPWGASAGLVPALVDGDESRLPSGLDEDFRATSLTHLLAVSGTNLTLLLAFALAVARGIGIRGRLIAWCGALTIGAFVLICRAEASVVRAAAMGVVALIGLGTNGRARGLRALSAAVVALVLFDPRIALSLGFTLSVAATGAILLLGPGFRDALQRWLPGWLAEALAIPLAAEVVCAPIVATVSGQVSLVGVVANLLAGPAVGLTTVSGLLGGVVGLASGPLSHLVVVPAVWGARWIIGVAHAAASHPLSTISLPPTSGIVGLAVVCVLAALYLPAVLRRRWTSLCLALALGVVVLVPNPLRSWPPSDWVFVACDVGQGDALVLRSDDRTAVVVDVGPDPAPVSRCLRELGVRTVPLLVLTHFHADHVNGLSGVLEGRDVGEVDHTDLAEPREQVASVERSAAAAQVPLIPVELESIRTIGEVRLQVLAPSGPPPASSGSPPNDASVVLVAEIRGLRILLMGDEENPSQRVLRERYPDLRADVLKVAHHGSSNQDFELIQAVGAQTAVISVGVKNLYHHPAPRTLDALAQTGARVLRTDLDGAVAISVGADGSPQSRTRGPVGRS